MTSGINKSGGPGGAGGPEGPGGTDDVGDVGDVGETEGAVEAGAPLEVHAAGAAAAGGVAPTESMQHGEIDRIAADLDAGRISGHEALERLLDEAVPPELGLGDAERAELRAAMEELIAHDPHLAALAARIGAGGGRD